MKFIKRLIVTILLIIIIVICAIVYMGFNSHNGIDFITTTRSMLENIKEKDIVAGGSTITQQVRKTFIFYTRTTFY